MRVLFLLKSIITRRQFEKGGTGYEKGHNRHRGRTDRRNRLRGMDECGQNRCVVRHNGNSGKQCRQTDMETEHAAGRAYAVRGVRRGALGR